MPSSRSSRARLRRARVAALLVATAASGCGGGDGGDGGDGDGGAADDPPAFDGAVTIREFAYAPKTIVVAAGTEVRWRNEDDARHTATAKGAGGFDTGTIEGGGSGGATLSEPGKLTYACAFHAFMKGTVEVR